MSDSNMWEDEDARAAVSPKRTLVLAIAALAALVVLGIILDVAPWRAGQGDASASVGTQASTSAASDGDGDPTQDADLPSSSDATEGDGSQSPNPSSSTQTDEGVGDEVTLGGITFSPGSGLDALGADEREELGRAVAAWLAFDGSDETTATVTGADADEASGTSVDLTVGDSTVTVTHRDGIWVVDDGQTEPLVIRRTSTPWADSQSITSTSISDRYGLASLVGTEQADSLPTAWDEWASQQGLEGADEATVMTWGLSDHEWLITVDSGAGALATWDGEAWSFEAFGTDGGGYIQ